MTINVRIKGASGEREIAKLLNEVIKKACPESPLIQRNSIQTAIGGCDLINTFCFAIEIKRCQVLQIDKWWQQAVKQAKDIDKVPVLLYRQNNKKWRCVMEMQFYMSSHCKFIGETSIDYFLKLFEEVVRKKLC
jgi:hypothetical protein